MGKRVLTREEWERKKAESRIKLIERLKGLEVYYKKEDLRRIYNNDPKLQHESFEDLDRSQKEEGRKIPYEEWIKRVYDIYDKIWYETPAGKRKISTEKIELLLGCSQTMSQRLRGTLKQMSREEVEELILSRYGLR